MANTSYQTARYGSISGLGSGSGGKILQVVSTEKTDTFTSDSTSYVDITGITASITPSASSSKILVLSSLSFTNDYSGGGLNHVYLMLLRGTTEIIKGDAGGDRTRSTMVISSQFGDEMKATPFVYLDSPSTTSSTTYKIQAKSGNSNDFFLNRSVNDTDNADNSGRVASTFTLMEVGA